MRLTLLKSGIMPDPQADQGHHHFTYSLLPHPGDWRAGAVIAHAAALNTPLRARLAAAGAGTSGDASHSLVTCDRPGLIIDTIKPAIDGRGLIVRFYEGHGTRGPATLTFAHPIAWIEECNLLEDRLDTPVRVTGHDISLEVLPYGLRTLRVGLHNRE